MTSPDVPVTLVTGGSSGIGAAIVRRLHADGHHVAATWHRHHERANHLTAALDPTGSRLTFTPTDLADPQAPSRLVTHTLGRFGRIDALVHAAAVIDTTPYGQLTAARAGHVLHTNLIAPLLLTQAAATSPDSQLRAVVHISSITERFTGPDSAIYEASKAALSMLTRSLAVELAPQGIRVNAVAPGAVEVERHTDDPNWPPTRDLLARLIPLGRPATPADIADVVAFLLSDHARYITGQILYADGGLSLRLS